MLPSLFLYGGVFWWFSYVMLSILFRLRRNESCGIKEVYNVVSLYLFVNEIYMYNVLCMRTLMLYTCTDINMIKFCSFFLFTCLIFIHHCYLQDCVSFCKKKCVLWIYSINDELGY